MTSKANHSIDLELYGIGALLALSVIGFIWVSFYYR
jgi:hypothetical protein